jgi:hypothetical protein
MGTTKWKSKTDEGNMISNFDPRLSEEHNYSIKMKFKIDTRSTLECTSYEHNCCSEAPHNSYIRKFKIGFQH